MSTAQTQTPTTSAGQFLRTGRTQIQPIDGDRHGGLGDGVFLHGFLFRLHQADAPRGELVARTGTGDVNFGRRSRRLMRGLDPSVTVDGVEVDPVVSPVSLGRGHSLVQPGENCERFTLRVEKVNKTGGYRRDEGLATPSKGLSKSIKTPFVSFCSSEDQGKRTKLNDRQTGSGLKVRFRMRFTSFCSIGFDFEV
ncbi:hypothetical protein V6N12_000159 [Hibiscus sabdariffa]|uniref:Uncharacterized protein n=1 Tax=Hibiscus sabdariffa TaxID=183260 RepID=A0ABR2B2S5_9ROSI